MIRSGRACVALLMPPRRPSTPAAGEPAEQGDAASVAPQKLRRRVLSIVRSDAAGGGEAGRSLPPVSGRLGAGPLVAIALAGAGVVLLATGVLQRGGPDPIAAQVAGTNRGVHASLRRLDDSAELVVTGMRQPPIGEVYEVWLGRSGHPLAPTDALFTVTSGGRASVEVPGGLRGVREVVVTSEPLGGSTTPTAPAELRVLLAHAAG